MHSIEAGKMFPSFQINFLGHSAAFIDSWEKLYNYGNGDAYTSAIAKTSFNYDDLVQLYVWKNGMTLSAEKSASFEKYIASQIDVINKLKQSFHRDLFDQHFGSLRAVWRIFLLHIINADYPIFDQHVYRAFAYIQHAEKRQLPSSQSKCMDIYDKEFIPFIWDLKELSPNHSLTQIDHALWAFGKFLKDYPGVLL
jgi:hypothetical protein